MQKMQQQKNIKNNQQKKNKKIFKNGQKRPTNPKIWKNL